MKLDMLMSRVGLEDLERIVGNAAFKLIQAMEGSAGGSEQIRQIAIGLRTPQGMVLDRGMRDILLSYLRPPEAARLCDSLGIPSYAEDDEYDRLKRIRCATESERRALLALFELEPLTSVEVSQASTWEIVQPSYALFEHQRATVDNLRMALARHPFRALLHMPTGSGKTRTLMTFISEEMKTHKTYRVAWLAFNEELCEQAATEFSKAWTALGDRPVSLLRFWGDSTVDWAGFKDRMAILGLAKLYSAAMASAELVGQLASSLNMVVIDEAHCAIAPTYALLINTLVDGRPATKLIGTSATPGRTWCDVDEDRKLSDFFANRKVGLVVPNGFDAVGFLTKEGYLAEAKFVPLDYNGPELTPVELSRISDSLEIPNDILIRISEDELRNLLLVKSIEQVAARHKRLLVFAVTVEHSDLIAAILRHRGFDCRSVTGVTSQELRRQAIKDFKLPDDSCRILCNFGVLTTGFDAPRASAAIIARPTKSLVLYSQMVGRVIRGEKAGGNRAAEVYTVIDRSLPGFASVAAAFNNWEDVWM